MSIEQPRRKRWATATRWPVGVTLAAWRYMWSTTPVHRWEMGGSWPADAPPELPTGAGVAGLQAIEDGEGPLIHRIYRTRVVGAALDPEGLLERLRDDLDQVAPSEFATFQKVDDEGRPLAAGDRYVVRMPGPWDGPVRVVDTGPTWFRLATLPGHLEAGQIEFRARHDYRSLWFEIESWARSGDRLSDALYNHLRISKEVQLHMWSSVLRRVVDLAGGTMEGGIVITTRTVAEEAMPGEEGDEERESPRDRERLRALADLRPNVDGARIDAAADDPGWHHDDMVEPLPGEVAGPPVEGGSWRLARELMDSYQLADPAVVHATYDEAAPLAGRDMLLRISFKGVPMRVGVRVERDFEETRRIDGRDVRVFGWSYVTLEGHFEEGRMYYELWKWLDSGEVEFHLRAISRPARSGPPLPIRVGFRAVGRTQQLRFYRQICRRVRRLTESQLETERAVAATPGTDDSL